MNAEKFFNLVTLCRANKRCMDAESDEDKKADYKKNYDYFCGVLDAEIDRVQKIIKRDYELKQ